MNWLPFIIYCILAVIALFVLLKAGMTNIDLSNVENMSAADKATYGPMVNRGKTSFIIWIAFWLIFWGVVLYYLTVTSQVKYAWLIILIPIAQIVTLFLSGALTATGGLWTILVVVLLVAIYIFTLYKTKNVIQEYGE